MDELFRNKEDSDTIRKINLEDLYEKKKTLPSRWNADHKYFYLPYASEPPCTFSVKDIIKLATNGEYNFDISVQNTCTNADKLDEHANGEMSIEVIIYKS